MSFFSSLDIVDWVALSGGVIGVLGGIAGILGAVASVRSNEIAKGARDDAQAANQLSATANGISIESNRIAVDANQIAKESKSHLERSEAMKTERNDVDWDFAWEGPGKLLLINGGQDEALRVHAAIYIDGTQFDASAERVSGRGGSIAIDPGNIGHDFIEEVLQAKRLARASPQFVIDQSGFLNLSVSVRVIWSTPLGQNRERETKPFMCGFDDVRADGPR